MADESAAACLDQKRAPKPTEKAVEEKLHRLKGERKGKLAQLTKQKNDLAKLKENEHNVNFIKDEELLRFERCLRQYERINEELCELIDEDDKKADQDAYQNRYSEFQRFIEDTNKWIADVLKDEEDDIRPHDSVSKANSVVSHTSSTTSAMLRIKAEREALLARAAAMKKREAIEQEEIRLRIKKEQLELETELAASDAKLKVYEDFEDAHESKYDLSELPSGPRFEPLMCRQEKHNVDDYVCRGAGKISLTFDPKPATQVGASDRRKSSSRFDAVSSTPHLNHHDHTDFSTDSLHEVLQRQNEVTEMLIKQQSLSQLPQRDIPTFTGDPLTYRSFIRAFEHAIDSKTDSHQDRLYYLEQFTSGEPLDLIRSCEHMKPDRAYKEARELLDRHYGDEMTIATAYIKKAMEWPQIRPEDRKGLNAFALFLVGCCNTVNDVDYMEEMNNPTNMKSILSKLPFKLKERWRSYAYDIQERTRKRARFPDLVEYVYRQAKVANDPLFGDILDSTSSDQTSSKKKPSIRKSESKRSSFAVNVSATENNVSKSQPEKKPFAAKSASVFQSPCLYCQKNHALNACNKIREQPLKERIQFLKMNGLCFGCLTAGHMSKDCKKRASCPDCSFKHPAILHVVKEDASSKNNSADDKLQSTSEVTSALARKGDHTGAGNSECILPIVPVQIKHKKDTKIIKTYAFLDQGSSATFCTEELAKKLNMRGRKTEFLLRTIAQEQKVNSYELTDLEVCGLEEQDYIQLPNVYTQPDIPAKKANIPQKKDLEKWSYLSRVHLPKLEAEVGLLIGVNAYKAMEPWEIINSQNDGPYAVKTALGWVVNGPISRCQEKESDDGKRQSFLVNRISVISVEDMLMKHYNADFPERRCDDRREQSQHDKQFMHTVTTSAQLVDGHFCIKLPLKDDKVKMPCNRGIAEQRLNSLKRKFSRNTDFFQEYKAFMDNILVKGYAVKIPEEQLIRSDGRVWFIPHHGVYHPKKRKLRVVFDCAATYQGVSLNDQLLQGPDLTNTLIGVLLRFRQEPVAMMADIESMFYQVWIPDTDADMLRFLWWPGGNLNVEAEEYRMCVHLFGATSSPSCASYALRRTAEDAASKSTPEATQTVLKNFYVDDCLKSVATEDKAVALARELMTLCASGGFHLTKWVSNSRALLSSIPDHERAAEVKDLDLEHDELPVERALGMQWCTSSDSFRFKIHLPDKPCTRRGILSVVSSVYDPMGFLAPLLLPIKLILRDLCQEKKGWDEEIHEKECRTWMKWLTDLDKLSELRLNRCFKPPAFGPTKAAQIHNFSDASRDGYGVVSYLLLTNDRGEKHVSFLMGKSRVAPLKQITIPRMELTAAMIAVKIDRMLKEELEVPLMESVFWTDSTTVLKYIENDALRFKTFVANRVSFIREATTSSQWKYVNTTQNPADQASRGLKIQSFMESKSWFQGPSFLRKEVEWPKQPEQCPYLTEDDVEVKTSAAVSCTNSNECTDPLNQLVEYYSSWHKLKKAAAWILHLRRMLRHLSEKRKEFEQNIQQNENDPEKCRSIVEQQMVMCKKNLEKRILTVEDLSRAEIELVKYSQRQTYMEEIEALQLAGSRVKKNSSIFKLDPYLQEDVLRVGGRLNRSAMPEEAKHPAILHKKHRIAHLILHHIHQEYGHGGRNHVLAILRQRYWIPRANAAARKVISECNLCRRMHAKAGEQKMADLPQDRLLPDKPPFTNTGVDYFGPFEVRRGRAKVKRYGVLFTCLTVRAVHIEVAHSLDTDSCINAIRRFQARRGQVSIIRSDNGTNFVGAERELREALAELDQSRINEVMMRKGVQWIFNPPAASHHGGIWERQIRTVRKVLSSVVKQQLLEDEGLHTLLCEVESIINGRPLTTNTDHPNDLEPLTPNHLLALKTQPSFPPGVFTKDDVYARRRWRQIQYMADLFWRRWTHEYLPLLQERQKWLSLKRSFKVGDVVLVADSFLPRNSWMLGRIMRVLPDSKGIVRSAEVRTKTSIIQRPITKLCLLQGED